MNNNLKIRIALLEKDIPIQRIPELLKMPFSTFRLAWSAEWDEQLQNEVVDFLNGKNHDTETIVKHIRKYSAKQSYKYSDYSERVIKDVEYYENKNEWERKGWS